MAFSHGTNTKLYAAGYDLSAFFTSVSIPQDIEALESTTFGQGSKTYVPGLRDATLSGEGLFSSDAVNEDDIDDVLSAALGSAVVWLVLPAGEAFGSRGKGLDAFQTSYDISSDVSGLVETSVEAQSQIGAEAVIVLTPWPAAKTTTGAGSAYDAGASSSAGGSIYIQALTTTTDEIVVAVEDSADGSTDWAEIGSLTSTTAARYGVRVVVSGTIRRYVRAAWTISDGTLDAIVALHRN